MSEKLFKCPACGFEFRRRNHSACPQCKAILKDIPITRQAPGSSNKKLEVLTVVANPQQPEVIQAHLAENIPPELPLDPEGELVSEKGDMPAVYYLGEEDKYNPKTGNTRRIKRYRVEYRGILHKGWCYCPGCWRKLFQNQMMDTGAFVQEFQCKDCSAISQFVFQSNRIPYRY